MDSHGSDSVRAKVRLRASADAVRGQALDLLGEASRVGMGRDPAHEVITRLQRVANDLGEAVRALPAESPAPVADFLEGMEPPPSQDAAVVLTLAAVTIPSGIPDVERAERWLRILRLYGRVGSALLRIGVPEAPFATVAEPTRNGAHDASAAVVQRSMDLARRAGAPTVDTVHVLFALRAVLGSSIDRALYQRGTTWDQLTESLVSGAHRGSRA